MTKTQNQIARWLTGAVGPVLMLGIWAADRSLFAGRPANADLQIVLLGLIALIARWAGRGSALVSGAILAAADGYTLVAAAGSGRLAPEDWIHLCSLFLAVILIAIAGSFSRDSAASSDSDRWSGVADAHSESSMQRVDVVTGLLARPFALQMAKMEWNRWRRFGTPLSLLLVELDHFDSLRHSDPHTADSLLRTLANRFTSVLRAMDVASRVEDGRFLVILPQTNGAGALVAGHKLLKAARQTRLDASGSSGIVTLSIGAADVRRSDDSLQSVLQRAEAALQRVRRADGDGIASEAVDQPVATE